MLSSTGISDADREKYDARKAKFDAFFKVRRNERAKFNRRAHFEGESNSSSRTCIHWLKTDYGTLKDEICDRILVGICNTALSKRMQGEATLTLEKAKTMARLKEAIAEQNLQLRGDGSKQSPIVLRKQTAGKET